METIIYKIKKGDTLQSLKKQFGCGEQSIIPSEFEEGDRVVIRLGKEKFYIVKPQDTLQSIAAKLNIKTEDIIKKNGSNTIFVGKHLRI